MILTTISLILTKWLFLCTISCGMIKRQDGQRRQVSHVIVRYSKFLPEVRDRIRALESKGHIGYIRYLLMRRWTLPEINSELMRLGLSWAEEEDLKLYFREVMFPAIQEHRLTTYYKDYNDKFKDDRLYFTGSFRRSEEDRKSFCACIILFEIDFFFAGEILEFYVVRDSIPVDTKTGKPIIVIDTIPNFTDLLNHSRRHMIETMLIDGKTPKMIADYLDHTYDAQIDFKDIAFFANAFFKTKRRDLERTIEDIQMEVEKLERSLQVLRDMDEETMSIGERTTAIATTKVKIEQLSSQVRRLMGSHSQAAYNVGVLEYSDMREAFADIFRRGHRRIRDMDLRTEDAVVDGITKLAGMMTKLGSSMMSLDEKMSETSKRTIADEMLEVVVPSLERVLQEEKDAYLEYQREFGGELPVRESDIDEILGLED
jgi:hypothetical protein